MLRFLTTSLILVFLASGCKDEGPELSEYTGNTISYSLFSASEVGSAGDVTFRERTDKSVDIEVTLDKGFDGKYPVHLHYGDLSVSEAPQATLLAEYDGTTGRSITTISVLADERPFTFEDVNTFDGSVKIHLANNGPDYDVILSAGNIGSNAAKGFNLQGIANCGDEIAF